MRRLRLRRARVFAVTTFCSSAVIISLAGLAAGTEPIGEAELVAAWLAGPAAEADARAWTAEAASAGVAGPSLPNPELVYRHDEARGPAGARTDAVGASLTLDPGFVGVGLRAAANKREEAIRQRRRAAVVAGACSLRADARALWRAGRERAALEAGQARLDTLLAALDELVEGGEASGYDRDRVSLSAHAHRADLTEATGRHEEQIARLSARIGRRLDAVSLLPPGPLPELEAALAAALEQHPELAAVELERQAAELERAAARRRAVPDLTLSAAARFDAEPDGRNTTPGFEVGAALELPLLDSGRRERSVASADLERAAAERLRIEVELTARVEGAWRRASSAGELAGPPVDPEALWLAARARYVGGEASVDELLQAAADVEAAQLAALRVEALVHAARLDLSCASGTFSEPAIRTAIEETLR